MLAFIKSFFWLPGVIAILVYFQALGFDSIWDDDPYIVDSPIAKNLRLMIQGFYKNSPGTHFFPLSYFQCYLINFIFKDNAFPFGFHLYSLILHSITSIISAYVVYLFTNNRIIAILISSLWVVHPIHVETMTRLVCSPAHIPACTFALLFLLSFLMLNNKRNILKYNFLFSFLGIIFFLISVTSYEQYILFPLVVTLAILFKNRNNLYEKNVFVSSLLFVIFVYVFYFFWRYFASGGNVFYTGIDQITWTKIGSFKEILIRTFWLAPQLLVHYLRLFFYPDFLSEAQADWYLIGNSFFSPYSLFCQFLLLILIIAGVILWKKIPLFGLGIGWFLVCMIPVIQIIPLYNIVDEHYCYLSLLGILISLAGLIVYWQKHFSTKLMILIFTPIFILLLWRTIIYLPNHKNVLTYFIAMAQHSSPWIKPSRIVMAIDLAFDKKRENELPPSLNEKLVTESLEKWIIKYSDLKGGLYLKYGPMQSPLSYMVFKDLVFYLNYTRQFDTLNKLLDFIPKQNQGWIGWYTQSSCLRILEKWDMSWAALKKAIKSDPRFKLSYDSDFIKVSMKSGNLSEALHLLNNYKELIPNHAFPYLFLGLFLWETNEKDKALEYFSSGISNDKILSLNEQDLYFFVSNAFLDMGKYEEARKTLTKILSFDPFYEKAQLKSIEVENLGFRSE